MSNPVTNSPLQRALILITVTLVTLLYAMTVTIANVALPQMQGALAATQDQIAWVVTFNIVATAVVTPLAGWLATRYGRRRLMLWSVLGFALSSLLCGLAGSLEALVLYRVMQGAFGAPLVPVSQAIVLDTYPKHQHGAATAVFGMGVIIGPILGPTLGGYLSEAFNWRWVFFMIVPVALLAWLGVLIFIRKRDPNAAGGQQQVRLDWTGFISLAIAVATFQLILDRGQRNDWLESNEIVLYAVVAGLAFYLFIAHSLTARAPFLNPALFKDRNFVLGLIIVLVFGMLNFTPMTLLPPLLQNLRGYPDSIIGFLLGMRGLGTLFGFTLLLFVNRLDPRYLLALGFLLQAFAGWQMAQFDLNLTTFDVAWTSCLQGLGVGLVWVPVTLITFATLDPKLVGEGTAIFHLLRNIGSSIFISLSIALVLYTSSVSYSDMVQFISPFNDSFQLPSNAGGWSLDSL
ncbi:MAG: DHA2 family efflux MFS transporter permease subunit, partial [Candidatus Competibacteraceae bacterium]|nr:DHA2 family efflux MFS transporter permease subunit [Candidatus Competibacteraceae bacterium]